MSEHRISVMVNDQVISATVEARLSLGDFLRGDAGCTGVHLGCEHGVCGACTILLDGSAVRSCLLLAVQVDGAEITTVEGLAERDGTLHRVQQAMRDSFGLQCGFCTSGILMTMAALTQGAAQADEDQLLAAMTGHVCRCTGYQGIRRAVRILAGNQAEGEHA